MTTDELLTILQFSDGLFPAGGYAHSFGLETLISEGRVGSVADVAQVLGAYLAGEIGPRDAVFAVHARYYAMTTDLKDCVDLDYQLEAAKLVRETRAASRQLGRQTLRVARNLFGHSILSGFAWLADAGRTPSHHAVVLGIIGGVCGWTPEATAAVLLYSSSMAMIGAATRLVPLGQTQAQRLLRAAAPVITSHAEEAARRPLRESYTFAPALEIAAMQHARLDARLFKS